jgi:hypothetical protein
VCAVSGATILHGASQVETLLDVRGVAVESATMPVTEGATMTDPTKCKWCGESNQPQCCSDEDIQILLHTNCQTAYQAGLERAAKAASGHNPLCPHLCCSCKIAKRILALATKE